MFTDLPLEIIGEIAGKSRSSYLGMIRAYPAFARSLTFGDRLDFAEKFGYDCRVENRRQPYTRIVWFLNGQLHRTDGPAIECVSGNKWWYIGGRLHRTDGPAIEWSSGSKEWYLDGKRHRTDGPAFEGATGFGEWYIDGKRHRVDGPAIIYRGGNAYWYLNGVGLSEREFAEAVSRTAT